MPEKRRRFDREFREGAVRIVRETNKPIAQVAADLGINPGSLGNWVKQDKINRTANQLQGGPFSLAADNAGLNNGLRPHVRHDLWETFQTVADEEEHIPDPAVLQIDLVTLAPELHLLDAVVRTRALPHPGFSLQPAGLAFRLYSMRNLRVSGALLMLLCACGSPANLAGAPGPSAEPPRPLPNAVQLPAPTSLTPLSAPQVNRVVSAAAADPVVAAALQQGKVARVQVRAASTGSPVGEPAGVVAFLFETAVDPAMSPWPVLCDIAGQTRQWRGVTARVLLSGHEISSSPVWMSGANCVGMNLPGQ